jgi:hypothetical protein
MSKHKDTQKDRRKLTLSVIIGLAKLLIHYMIEWLS